MKSWDGEPLITDAHRASVDRLLTAEHSFPRPGVVVCTVRGEVDVETAPLLAEAVWKAVSAAQHVIVDLRHVTFFAAAGLKPLIEAAKAQDGGRSLCLVVDREVTRTLHAADMQALLPTFADRKTALIACGAYA